MLSIRHLSKTEEKNLTDHKLLNVCVCYIYLFQAFYIIQDYFSATVNISLI